MKKKMKFVGVIQSSIEATLILLKRAFSKDTIHLILIRLNNYLKYFLWIESSIFFDTLVFFHFESYIVSRSLHLYRQHMMIISPYTIVVKVKIFLQVLYFSTWHLKNGCCYNFIIRRCKPLAFPIFQVL